MHVCVNLPLPFGASGIFVFFGVAKTVEPFTRVKLGNRLPPKNKSTRCFVFFASIIPLDDLKIQAKIMIASHRDAIGFIYHIYNTLYIIQIH